MSKFKILKFEDLKIDKSSVSFDILQKALILYSESESGSGDLLKEHPWIKAAKLLWENDSKIGLNAWASGC